MNSVTRSNAILFYKVLYENVYKNMSDSSKYSNGNPKQNMWEERVWKAMDDAVIYRSGWTWSL